MENFLTLFTFIFGLLIGSFMNVVILRLPLSKDIVFDRSGCTSCKRQLKWFDNIPVVSYLLLKGKCRYCNNPISLQYPLIEVWHGVLAILLLNNWWNYGLAEGLEKVSYFVIASIFTAHFIIDLRHHLLLDKLNISLLLPILYLVFRGEDWKGALIGGAFGAVFPLAVTWIFYKIKGVIGLGGGDIKLFGLLGLLLGIKGVILNIFTSCLIGSVITIILILLKKVKRDQFIAFGPFILLTAWLQIFHPELFERWRNILIPYY